MNDFDLAALRPHLQTQRDHVLGILDGLNDDQMTRPVLPSGWSCAGLLRHLALDDERFWFRGVVAADATVIASVGTQDDTWQIPPDLGPDDLRTLYRRECELADRVLDEVRSDAAPGWWPDNMLGWRAETVQTIVLHVITETACHAGHLDAARELLDGRQWLVLPG